MDLVLFLFSFYHIYPFIRNQYLSCFKGRDHTKYTYVHTQNTRFRGFSLGAIRGGYWGVVPDPDTGNISVQKLLYSYLLGKTRQFRLRTAKSKRKQFHIEHFHKQIDNFHGKGAWIIMDPDPFFSGSRSGSSLEKKTGSGSGLLQEVGAGSG